MTMVLVKVAIPALKASRTLKGIVPIVEVDVVENTLFQRRWPTK
jgi:hypothetical protein